MPQKKKGIEGLNRTVLKKYRVCNDRILKHLGWPYLFVLTPFALNSNIVTVIVSLCFDDIFQQTTINKNKKYFYLMCFDGWFTKLWRHSKKNVWKKKIKKFQKKNLWKLVLSQMLLAVKSCKISEIFSKRQVLASVVITGLIVTKQQSCIQQPTKNYIYFLFFILHYYFLICVITICISFFQKNKTQNNKKKHTHTHTHTDKSQLQIKLFCFCYLYSCIVVTMLFTHPWFISGKMPHIPFHRS